MGCGPLDLVLLFTLNIVFFLYLLKNKTIYLNITCRHVIIIIIIIIIVIIIISSIRIIIFFKTFLRMSRLWQYYFIVCGEIQEQTFWRLCALFLLRFFIFPFCLISTTY